FRIDNQTLLNLFFDLQEIDFGLASSQDLTSQPFFEVGSNSEIVFLTLPATDNYVLNIHVKHGDTGNLTFSLFDSPPDVTGTITINGAATHVPAPQPFQNGPLPFSGTSGQVLILNATAPTASSAFLTIFDPDNNSIFGTFIGSVNTPIKLPALP